MTSNFDFSILSATPLGKNSIGTTTTSFEFTIQNLQPDSGKCLSITAKLPYINWNQLNIPRW